MAQTPGIEVADPPATRPSTQGTQPLSSNTVEESPSDPASLTTTLTTAASTSGPQTSISTTPTRDRPGPASPPPTTGPAQETITTATSAATGESPPPPPPPLPSPTIATSQPGGPNASGLVTISPNGGDIELHTDQRELVRLTAQNGSSPYTWRLGPGGPNWATLTSTGILILRPTEPGETTITVTVNDADGRSQSVTYGLVVVLDNLEPTSSASVTETSQTGQS